MRTKTTAVLILALAVGCMAAPSADNALSRITVGMTEAEVVQILGSHVKDKGTVYWGGTGAHRLYFQIGDAQQTWVDIGAGPTFKVVAVGKLEPKVKWTRHGGDSITLDI